MRTILFGNVEYPFKEAFKFTEDYIHWYSKSIIETIKDRRTTRGDVFDIALLQIVSGFFQSIVCSVVLMVAFAVIGAVKVSANQPFVTSLLPACRHC